MLETVLTVLGGGAISGLITWGSLKKDVEWIRVMLVTHDERIKFLERK